MIPAGKIESIPWNFWNNGVIHTESNDISGSHTSALLQAISFLACPSISDSKYWTLLEMNPATFAYTSHSIQDLKISSENMLFCQILKHFDQSIGDKPAFLDPDYHAKVFSDEEVPSRFKNYSWAISTPRELQRLANPKTLRARNERNYDQRELEGHRQVRAMLCSELRNIENRASKLETKQKEATYLRDESAWSINFSVSYLNPLLTANLLAAAT
ncbi:hypothetical protein BOTNAR_0682g00010 [Botryotinia narcissicola]|uniref:Uncharacterized protein n=1 Tax=Botryotinia narcissicola TaxID=278944 RepID=A0A4Z1H8T9_9HELO|nr:hypothetical protein BOTNAR_0682g00010 [Botryotinia narcissicola]